MKFHIYTYYLYTYIFERIFFCLLGFFFKLFSFIFYIFNSQASRNIPSGFLILYLTLEDKNIPQDEYKWITLNFVLFDPYGSSNTNFPPKMQILEDQINRWQHCLEKFVGVALLEEGAAFESKWLLLWNSCLTGQRCVTIFFFNAAFVQLCKDVLYLLAFVN